MINLGVGTHSVVYKVRSSQLGRLVAVKLINLANGGEYVERFMDRELSIVTRLNHPNIVKVYDVCKSSHYIDI